MMHLLPLLFPALAAFAVSALVLVILGPSAKRLGLLDWPGGRKAHRGPVPMLGGPALLVACLVVAACGFASLGTLAFVGPWLLLFAIGLADDLGGKRMQPGTKALGTLAGLLLCWWLQPDRGSLLTLAPAFVLLHSFNTSDNMNGLAGGFGLSGCAALLALAVAGLLPGIPLATCAALAGALVAFLLLNYPRGQVFLGDSGSMLLGGWFACTFLGHQHPALLLLAALPVADFVTVAWLRFRKGRAPWRGDHQHVSHRLARLGMGEAGAVALLLVAQLPWTIGTIFLLGWSEARPESWLFTLLALTLACAGTLAVGDYTGGRMHGHRRV